MEKKLKKNLQIGPIQPSRSRMEEKLMVVTGKCIRMRIIGVDTLNA